MHDQTTSLHHARIIIMYTLYIMHSSIQMYTILSLYVNGAAMYRDATYIKTELY